MSEKIKAIETRIVRLLSDAETALTPDEISRGIACQATDIDYETALLTLLDERVLCWFVLDDELHYGLQRWRDGDSTPSTPIPAAAPDARAARFALWDDSRMTIVTEDSEVDLTSLDVLHLLGYLMRSKPDAVARFQRHEAAHDETGEVQA